MAAAAISKEYVSSTSQPIYIMPQSYHNTGPFLMLSRSLTILPYTPPNRTMSNIPPAGPKTDIHPSSLPIQSKPSSTMTTTTTTTTPPSEPTTNPRGIPSFPFLPHVTDYVKSPSETEATLTRFQEMIQKYNFMQTNVERRAQGLKEKLPEMKRTLDVVRFLISSKSSTISPEEETPSEDRTIETTFPLQDTLYAHATIHPKTLDEVYLWLGANVMVSYPLPEAETLLSTKLSKAKESLQAAEEDLEFLRVQVTTLEVATARVHNWDVGEKRKLKEKDEGGGKK